MSSEEAFRLNSVDGGDPDHLRLGATGNGGQYSRQTCLNGRTAAYFGLHPSIICGELKLLSLRQQTTRCQDVGALGVAVFDAILDHLASMTGTEEP
jgi:hypothetical protein